MYCSSATALSQPDQVPYPSRQQPHRIEILNELPQPKPIHINRINQLSQTLALMVLCYTGHPELQTTIEID